MIQVDTLIRPNAALPVRFVRNTGWLTGYELLFKAAGYSGFNQGSIRKLLVGGGYSSVSTAKSSGLPDRDMPLTAAALGLGTGYTSALTSIASLQSAFQHVGALWVAMQIPVNIMEPHGERYRHITVVVDVDEGRNRVAIVNSCKENYYSSRYKAWVDFEWFRRGVKYTQNLPAGCQFIKVGRGRSKKT